MKARSLILTAIVAIAAGAVLIIANKTINSTGIVIAAGILFIIAGLMNVFVFYSERKNKESGPLASTFSLVGNIGALVLGICMIIFQSTFIVLVPYIFGIIVAFLACYQFFVLAIGARPAVLLSWFYLVPVILIGGAVYLFMRHAEADDHLIMLVTGISLAFFGVFQIIEASMIPHLRKKTTESPAELKPLDESIEASASKPETTEPTEKEEEQPK